MPKKTRSLQDREFSEKCYFRWEFIRRNSTYLTDYEFFVGNFASWFEDRGMKVREIHGFDGFLLDDFFKSVGREEERYFAEEILPYVEAFHRKWGVAWPCDPEFLFDRDHLNPANDADGTFLDRIRDTPVVMLRSNLQPQMTLDLLISKSNESALTNFSELAKKLDQEAAKKPPTDFRVFPHMGMQWNKQRLSQILSHIAWEEFLSNRTPKTNRRQRFQEYEQYLQVWDFRKRFPKATWPNVALALYPTDYAQYEDRKHSVDKNAVIQRAKDRYARAKELINGGFVEIR